MKTASIKRNFLFNLLKNISLVLFPMITFPYLSRVLGPEGIGKTNFANSVIQYFVMLSALGIPLYGTREVAKVRENKTELNKLVNELFQINVFSTILAYLLFLILFFTNKKINSESLLFFITSLNILFTTLGIEWFYQGIERYEFITKRVLFVRTISIALMFVFVKMQQDYNISVAITALGLVGANIFNFAYSRKYIDYEFFKKQDIARHIKPLLILFGMNTAISIYVNLDSVMLGFMKGDEAVGFYTVAIKFNKLVLTLITSLGVVLIPRLSYYIQNKQWDEYRSIINKALNIILMLSLPSMVGLMILSKHLVFLFSGSGFSEAILTMQITAPIILFISLTGFIGIQILYPLNKEKLVLYSVICGAIVNFILNYILIPKYSHYGAGLATTIAEFCVLVVQIVLGRKYLQAKIINKEKTPYLLGTLAMTISVLGIDKLTLSPVITVFFSIGLGGIVYLGILLLFRDKILINEINKLRYRRK